MEFTSSGGLGKILMLFIGELDNFEAAFIGIKMNIAFSK